MADRKRNSKRISKPVARSSDNDLDELKVPKRNLKPKTKSRSTTSSKFSVPRTDVLNEVDTVTDPAVEKFTKPSYEDEAAQGKSNAGHSKAAVEEIHKPADESGTGVKKGRICNRNDLRPKRINGTTFTIDCSDMAESALEGYNMNVSDLKLFLHQNMKINKNNKITIQQGEWKLMVTSKVVIDDKKNFNKTYLKLLIKKFLWKREIKDWVFVDARLPTTLKVLYYRSEH